MRKRTRFKSLVHDTFFTLACLFAAVSFVRLFWRDLNAYTARIDKQAVATVTFKHKVAQRKFDDRVVWERISQNTELYDGDTISTAEAAEATLHFGDGTKLNLYENTMVRLSVNDEGGVSMSVSGGDIQVDTKEASGKAHHTIALGDGTAVNVQKGSVVAVAKTNGEAASVAVTDGKASVTGADGKKKSLSSGDAVAVSEDGAVREQSLTVLYPPKELTLFALAEDTSAREVRVSWKTSGGAVIVQTAGTRDFSAIASEKTVTDADGTTLSVTQSPCYWRVLRGEAGAEHTVAASGRITTERLTRVSLTSPAHETVFRYKGDVPSVNLRWSGVPFAEDYRLIISPNADLSQPVLSRVLSVPFASFEPTRAGTYYWQVVPVLPDNMERFPLESRVAWFSLEETVDIASTGTVVSETFVAEQIALAKADEPPEPEPEPPVQEELPAEEPPPPPPPTVARPYLLSPKYNLTLGNEYFRNNRTIYFSWQRIANADGYTFTLSKIEGRRKRAVVSYNNLTEPRLNLQDFSVLSNGTFEWEVTAFLSPRDGHGRIVSPAAASRFVINFASPGKIDAAEPEGVYGN